MNAETTDASELVGLNADITDLLEQGVVVLDYNFVVLSWNRWMEGATRLSARAVVGKPIFKIFPELVGTDRAVALERALNGEVVVYSHRFHEYFLPLAAPPGFPEVQRMQQTVRIARRMQSGKVTGLVILIQDVTERTVREAELRGALVRAEVANRAKADFLSSMSHELRTPLNVVLGYADLLASGIGGELTEDHQKKIERIKTSVWHLLGIIDDILTFSRVEAGKEQIKIEPVDIVGIVQDTVVMLQNEAAVRTLELTADVADESLVIETDARRVRQILLNLLGNAIKFTEKGEVRVTMDHDADTVRVHIADSGRGIDADRLEDVFEPFTRVEQTEGASGTGLGLPLSLRFAQLLGGDIQVRSEKGVGSTFTLALPRKQQERAAELV